MARPLEGGGISLVVIGHCLASCVLRSWIYNFHVPLLFMLSGYLNQTLHGGARRFRPKRVVLPYMIWALVSTVFYAILLNPDRSVLQLANDIIPATGFSSWNAPLWFLYALAFVDILKPRWRDAKTYLPIAAFIAAMFSVRFFCPSITNAFAWKNIVLGVVCYGLGEMIARYSIIEKLSSLKFAALVLLVIGSVIGVLNGGVSTYACHYGRSIWLLFIASVLISVALMAIFKKYEGKIPSWFAILGRCSLFIMVSHYFALSIFGKLLGNFFKMNVFTQCFEGVVILACYLVYFHLLSRMKLNTKLPDWLGGYKI